MNFLALQPLISDQIAEAVELDRRYLGGLWTQNGYQREIESPNSNLLALQRVRDWELGVGEWIDQENSSHPPTPHPTPDPPSLIGLACSWAILDEAHITLLAVDADYRGQGLGQLLLYALLVLAWRRGLEWATLEVRVSNQTAINLYRKFGFESVGQRRGYYQDTGEDALILWRKGLQRPEFQDCLKQWCQHLSRQLQQSGWHLSTFPDLGWNPANLFKSSSIPLT